MDFANKYRVNTFSEICGNRDVVNLMRNLVKDRKFPQFLSFYGEPGTCKTTLSYLIIKAYSCLNPTAEGEPCNACAACRAINDSLYSKGEPVMGLNIFNFSMAEEETQDENIRSIISILKAPNLRGTERFIIINELHNCSFKKQQNFLTPFEFMPPHTHVIMPTTDFHNKIADGIRSRTVAYQLEKAPQDEIIERLYKIALDEGIDITKTKLRKLVRIKMGNMRECLNTLEIIQSDPDDSWAILTKEYTEELEQLIEYLKACQSGIIELLHFIYNKENKVTFLKSLPVNLTKAIQLRDETDGIVEPDLRRRLNEITKKSSFNVLIDIIQNLLDIGYISDEKASSYLIVIGTKINRDIYRTVEMSDTQNAVNITASNGNQDLVPDMFAKQNTSSNENEKKPVLPENVNIMEQIQNSQGEYNLEDILGDAIDPNDITLNN